MSTETNKATIRRVFDDVVNSNSLAAAAELVGPAYVNHGVPVPAKGPEALRLAVGMFRAAFPDIKVTLEHVVAEGDRVATHGYFTGTHKGDFNGIPPTGKAIKVAYIDLWRLENGKATENWVQMDMVGLMQQLGVMPGA
jgi:steroid delta-isomerase-like uncharacterized protein